MRAGPGRWAGRPSARPPSLGRIDRRSTIRSLVGLGLSGADVALHRVEPYADDLEGAFPRLGRIAGESVRLGEAAVALLRDVVVGGAPGMAGVGVPAKGTVHRRDDGLFEGEVRLEVGPLRDFSQLARLEEAITGLGGSDVRIERVSKGRATLALDLDSPVDLLRELEERAALDFRMRRVGQERVVLDVDDEPNTQAA
jgi:hypothetical protein